MCSSSVTSAEPSATGRYGWISEVMPNLCTYSITVLMPTRWASLTAGMLRESASARRSEIVPSYLPS